MAEKSKVDDAVDPLSLPDLADPSPTTSGDETTSCTPEFVSLAQVAIKKEIDCDEPEVERPASKRKSSVVESDVPQKQRRAQTKSSSQPVAPAGNSSTKAAKKKNQVASNQGQFVICLPDQAPIPQICPLFVTKRILQKVPSGIGGPNQESQPENITYKIGIPRLPPKPKIPPTPSPSIRPKPVPEPAPAPKPSSTLKKTKIHSDKKVAEVYTQKPIEDLQLRKLPRPLIMSSHLKVAAKKLAHKKPHWSKVLDMNPANKEPKEKARTGSSSETFTDSHALLEDIQEHLSGVAAASPAAPNEVLVATDAAKLLLTVWDRAVGNVYAKPHNVVIATAMEDTLKAVGVLDPLGLPRKGDKLRTLADGLKAEAAPAPSTPGKDCSGCSSKLTKAEAELKELQQKYKQLNQEHIQYKADTRRTLRKIKGEFVATWEKNLKKRTEKLTPIALEMWQRLERPFKSDGEYSQGLREFCLGLHDTSPSAYLQLLKVFPESLPSLTSISKWMSTDD